MQIRPRLCFTHPSASSRLPAHRIATLAAADRAFCKRRRCSKSVSKIVPERPRLCFTHPGAGHGCRGIESRPWRPRGPSWCFSFTAALKIRPSLCFTHPGADHGGSSVRSSVRPSASVRPSVRPSSVRPSVRPSVHPPARPSVRPSARLSVRPSVRPPVRPSVRPTNRVYVKFRQSLYQV